MQTLWKAHAYMRKFGICRLCFRDLAYKGQIPVFAKQAGSYLVKGGKTHAGN